MTQPNRDREGADSVGVPRPTTAPLAYFITFRTFGTWLPGDARQTVDDSHNVLNTPRIPQNEGREKAARERMTGESLTLSWEQRGAVDRAIRGVCTHCGWTLHELNVRTNHVHVVVTAQGDPELVMNRFKSWATRRLVEAGLVERGRKTWARHGSTIYLWTPAEFDGACKYVRDGQDKEYQAVVTTMIRVRSDVRDWDRREG